MTDTPEAVAWMYERGAPWPARYYHDERTPQYLAGDKDFPWTETPLYTRPDADIVRQLVEALDGLCCALDMKVDMPAEDRVMVWSAAISSARTALAAYRGQS